MAAKKKELHPLLRANSEKLRRGEALSGKKKPVKPATKKKK